MVKSCDISINFLTLRTFTVPSSNTDTQFGAMLNVYYDINIIGNISLFLGGGISYGITPKTNLDLGYRYGITTQTDYDANIASHEITLGARYTV